jgi:hypothetical protein
MYGRSCWCLLAISLLIAWPPLLHGQTDRPRILQLDPDWAADFKHDFGPRLPIEAESPAVALRRGLPRAPIEHSHPTGFSQITRAAGTIFSGTVMNIARRPAAHGQAVETVAITFHVESALRGATPGEDLSILQWIGLWSGGQRYRVGERVLLFLYPPSKLGLTSSVAGPMGRFTVDPWGRVLLSAQHLSAFRGDRVLGGKSRVRVGDFALAVRQASEEE